MAVGLALLVPGRASAAGVAQGFDACSAPSTSVMQSWYDSSPYRVVNAYIGGVDRACAQPNLTALWVRDVEAQGWTIIPTYVGQQAPCSDDHLANPVDPAQAGAEGTAAADDAVVQARRLGLEPASPIYDDMESYTGNTACHTAVLQFLAAWTQELHAQGYRSGVYGSLASLVKDEVANYGKPGTPDDLWYADWDNHSQELTNSAIPSGDWANHHRIHQYSGNSTQTYGGATLQIDGDAVDGDVATQATGVQPSQVVTAAYTGTWQTDSAHGWANDEHYSPSAQSGTATATATWAPSLASGSYLVEVFDPSGGHATTTDAQYSITDATGTRTVAVDQTDNSDVWLPLGTFTATSTQPITVTLTNVDPAGPSSIGADDARFASVPSSRLSLARAASVITYRGPTTLAATLRSGTSSTGPAGQVVQLLSRPHGAGSWHAVDSATTGSGGHVSFTVRPMANTDYRAAYSGSATYGATTSATATVWVRPRVTASFSRDPVRAGHLTHLTGRVVPSYTAAVARVQRRSHGHWRTVGRTTISARSRFSFAIRWGTDGTHRYRVRVAATASRLVGVSPTATLHVSG